LCDVDHFKKVNDNYGHPIGDEVLRRVARVLQEVPRKIDIPARYGGEEFAMLFPGESTTQVAACLEEIRNEISSRMLKRRSTNEDLGTITISAGFAELHAGETLHNCVERADAALYASKRAGRNRVTSAEQMQDAA
ncbi:MAG TPA: GGDEF domain-containing protein, partial [Phycisphaerales bacterium]|nr:GGDEF domain-containing protein [Phycisphaerales bacterium]